MTKPNETGAFKGAQFQKALSAPPEKSGDLGSGLGKPEAKAFLGETQ